VRRLLLIAAVATLSAAVAPAAIRAEFPVPRAQEEFQELLPFLTGWGRANAGEQELFKRWAMPYGPLDLQVQRATHEESDALRNYYLGVAGAAFGVDPKGLTTAFHCGPDCVDHRRQDLVVKLPRIKSLANDFRALKGVNVLSIWGLGDDCRINNLFRIMGQQRETRPSSVMGFVPSGVWRPVDDVDKYITALGAKSESVRHVLQEMRELSIAALVREKNNVVRLVRVGIGDNESGLLLLRKPGSEYSRGQKLPDGRKVQLLEPLESTVLFYETT
jgi:hypothetical protein